MLKNRVEDLLPEKNTFNGIYRGVVEDNKDPLKAGRVRVRIFGLHTEKKQKDLLEGIPVNELPWAEPCLSLVEGSVSGFGMWSVPVQGSHIFLFFENGSLSAPRYFATVPGIPEETPDSKEGFSDPDGNYPSSSRIGEPDVHRLARGVSSETLVTTKNQQRITGVTKAGGGTWDEPSSPYATVYPNNTIIVTRGGITVELDSTPNAKRVHIYHPSNSYIEIDDTGNMVIKNNSSKYEIVLQDNNIAVKQNNNLSVDGDITSKAGGNEIREVGGNIDVNVIGNEERVIGGALNITVTGTANITATVAEIESASVKLGQVSTGTLKKILNEEAATLYNSHTHDHGDAAGTTTIPNQQMDSGDMTTNTTAT